MLSGSEIAAAMLPMLEPPTFWLNVPIGTVLSESVLPTAQFTPSSAVLCSETSTRIASTSTCRRRMSSLSTTPMIERMIFGGAVTTSALVCLSAQIVVLRSAAACGPPCAPGAPGAACVMPVTCSFSLPAICSASA